MMGHFGDALPAEACLPQAFEGCRQKGGALGYQGGLLAA